MFNRTLRRRLSNTEDPFNYRQCSVNTQNTCKHTKHESYGSQTRTSVESITEAQGRGGFTVTETKGEVVFLNNLNCYRPQTKLHKGNVFTSVCQVFCPQRGGVHPPCRRLLQRTVRIQVRFLSLRTGQSNVYSRLPISLVFIWILVWTLTVRTDYVSVGAL